MRTRRRTAGLLLIVLAVLAAVLASAAKTKPNLLLITIDTLRPDRLGCYGSPHLPTPAVDALAARGVLFTRAFAHTPMTLPSHANILLGVTPPAHGVHDNAHFIVPADRPALAPHLKTQGYATAAFVGAYPLDARFGLNRGFDIYDDDFGAQDFASRTYVERPASAVIERALAWIKSQPGPWFAWIHCFDPHVPYAPPEPYLSRFRDRPYDGEVAFVDDALSRLFETLRAGGREANLVIVFTADHGEALGEHGEATHGYFAYNSTIHVPLILAGPGLKSRRTDAVASHVDIFPTVCELLDVRPPAGLEGLSLVPAANGRRLPERPIYLESLYPYYSRGWAPLRGVIAGPRKFLDSPLPELYNLRTDFDEAADLAASADLSAFRKILASFLVREGTAGGPPPADAAAREKLRSLGYVSGSTPRPEGTFTARDDIKTLLPFENRTEEANRLAHEGKTEAAARLLKEILSERDDIDVAYTALAALYKNSGRLTDALTVLSLARDKLPQNYDVFLTAVSYLLAAGRNADVVRLFETRTLP
ncbi:MAG: sulfatase-like hydrolase/transferase, partial [Candidatus Aminicenantes bacterium]|nr:sulfatase-like hydrolase/transferase [Candidatus Aminicenantes bacterium]